MSARIAGFILAPLVVGAAIIYSSTRPPSLLLPEVNGRQTSDFNINTAALSALFTSVVGSIKNGAGIIGKGIIKGAKYTAIGIGGAVAGSIGIGGTVVAGIGAGVTDLVVGTYNIAQNDPGPQTVAMRAFMLALARVLYVNPDDVPPELIVKILQIKLNPTNANINDAINNMCALLTEFGTDLTGVFKMAINDNFNNESYPLLLLHGPVKNIPNYTIVAYLGDNYVEIGETTERVLPAKKYYIEKLKEKVQNFVADARQPQYLGLDSDSDSDSVSSSSESLSSSASSASSASSVSPASPVSQVSPVSAASAASLPSINARLVLYAKTDTDIESHRGYFKDNQSTHDDQIVAIKQTVVRMRGTDIGIPNTIWRKTQISPNISQPPLSLPMPMQMRGGAHIARNSRHNHKIQAPPTTLTMRAIYAYIPLYIIKGARIFLYKHLAKDQPLGPYSWRWILADIILTLLIYTILSSIGMMHFSVEAILTDASFGMVIITCATIIINMMQNTETTATAVRIDNLIAQAMPWILSVPIIQP
jgi:hypothetical protein